MKTSTHPSAALPGLLLFFCLLCVGSHLRATPTATLVNGPFSKVKSPSIADNGNRSVLHAATPEFQAPVLQFIITNDGNSDVGESVTAIIKAYAPNGGSVTLRIDSTEAYGNNVAVSLADATFSPALPLQAPDTATVTMTWTPKREHLGYEAFHFTAIDQQGNYTSDYLLYLVDMPIVIKPTPTIQLAVNEAFELIIPVEDADWHELYEAVPGEGMPAWLSAEVVAMDGTGGPNAIRLWGTPGAADRKEYKFTVLVRAIFGKEASTNLHLRVVKGRNQSWYMDSDGDGYGHPACLLTACRQPQGYARQGGDCKDNDATTYPGATELADGQDNNCDGNADEGGSCFATNVVSFRQGFRPDGKTIGTTRSTSQHALGAPQENNTYNFVSLGFGGELVLELGALLYDNGSEAPDLMVVETTWGWANRPCYDGKGAGTPETMVMEVSANGTDWAAVPGSFCRNAKVDISTVVGEKRQLPYVRYIKITDTSDPAAFHPSSNGYDVDGIITCPALFGELQANARTVAPAGGFNPDFINEAPDDEVDLQAVSFYPNPVREVLTIQTGVQEAQAFELQLFNLQGSLLFRGTYTTEPTSGNLRVNLQSVNQGTYLLRLQGKDNLQHYLKIIKE